jgi:hypothetical protein
MRNSLNSRVGVGFHDLMPWGDPYIVALMDKLRQADAIESADNDISAELPPPLDSDEGDDYPSQPDWSPRDRPGN